MLHITWLNLENKHHMSAFPFPPSPFTQALQTQPTVENLNIIPNGYNAFIFYVLHHIFLFIGLFNCKDFLHSADNLKQFYSERPILFHFKYSISKQIQPEGAQSSFIGTIVAILLASNKKHKT